MTTLTPKVLVPCLAALLALHKCICGKAIPGDAVPSGNNTGIMLCENWK